jgi:metallo-beta-lactamase family protein
MGGRATKDQAAGPPRLTFLGAAENVTGSRYLLEWGGARVLVDCGLYQEREFLARNWDPFPVPPATIDTVLLTHAHVDHCGYLPRLVHDGFRGRVIATRATAEIAAVVLEDSAKIQVEDAAFKKKRHARERRTGPHPEVPLYTPEDVEATLPLLAPADYGADIPLGAGLTARFRDAGHILGSGSVLVRFGRGRDRRGLLFSGDVGRWDKPLLNDPEPAAEADWIVVESTYGDRVHDRGVRIGDRLATVITETRRRGGNIVVPSFALERAQELLWYLAELLAEDRIQHLMVFVDSPMAVAVTDIFERHPEVLDPPMRALLARRASPFRFPGLKMIRTVDESKAINHISGTVMIIAGSGMCTGGRIKHHLDANLGRPESTVLFVGYQAVGTLGRQIQDGSPEVRLFGKMRPVRARIESIPGFSAHADRDELTRWFSGVRRPPRRVFVTHGEPEAAAAFARHVGERLGWQASVPRYGESFVLE